MHGLNRLKHVLVLTTNNPKPKAKFQNFYGSHMEHVARNHENKRNCSFFFLSAKKLCQYMKMFFFLIKYMKMFGHISRERKNK